MRTLNLARRPFVNVKPVRRAGLLMLILGGGLMVLNGVLYWQHFSGESETRGKSQDLTRLIAEEEAEVERLRSQISSVDLDLLNRRARYVNLEIDRRGFSWSRLFDQLVEAQPQGVRLLTMTPQFPGGRRGSARRRQVNDEVVVQLLAVARNGEAILEFIDNLFQHPAFSEPDITQEARQADDTIGFDISVLYDPEFKPSAGEVPSEEGPPPADPSEEGTEQSAEPQSEPAEGDPVAAAGDAGDDIEADDEEGADESAAEEGDEA